MFDYLIIGAGAAGTAAAYALRGQNVAVLDVGNTFSSREPFRADLYDLKRSGPPAAEELLGKDFESLHNVSNTYLMPKLKAPLLRYVIAEEERFAPIEANGFFAKSSFAKGGFANVWGAQVYRFTEQELEKFPLSRKDLDPTYDELQDHIGISGTNDDLERYFGRSENLHAPVSRAPISDRVFKRYHARKGFFQRRGFRIGEPRLAVLTKDHGERPAYKYDGLEFFQPGNRSVYSPAYTLDELIAKKLITYLPRRFAVRYEEVAGGVSVTVENLSTGINEKIEARSVILAAGPLNTARLVLSSNGDSDTKLPILDNEISYVPILDPLGIGSPNSRRGLSIQLAMVYEGELQPHPIMCTFYKTAGVLRSDLLLDFPLPFRANFAAARYVLPALSVIQLWYPGVVKSENYLKLRADGVMQINYRREEQGTLEKHIVNTFLLSGYLTHLSLCRYPLAGNSFHYAGTLPMVEKPEGKYQTDRNGALFGTSRVFVADASTFPELPSKNLTFTTMANSMRISKGVMQSLQRDGETYSHLGAVS